MVKNCNDTWRGRKRSEKKQDWTINKSHIVPIYVSVHTKCSVLLCNGCFAWFHMAFLAIFRLCSGSMTKHINFWKHWIAHFHLLILHKHTNMRFVAVFSKLNCSAWRTYDSVLFLATISICNFHLKSLRKDGKKSAKRNRYTWMAKTMLKQMICASVSKAIATEWVRRWMAIHDAQIKSMT